MVRGLGGRIPKAQRLAAKAQRREEGGPGEASSSEDERGEGSSEGGGDSEEEGRGEFESLPRRVRKRMVKRVSFLDKLHRTHEGILRDKARALQRRGVKVGVRKKGAALKSLGGDLLGELDAVEAGLERREERRRDERRAERARVHGKAKGKAKPSRKQRMRMRKHAEEEAHAADAGMSQDVHMDGTESKGARDKKRRARTGEKATVRPPNVNGSVKKKLQRMKRRMLRDGD